MLGLKLNHVSKRGHCQGEVHLLSMIILLYMILNMKWETKVD